MQIFRRTKMKGKTYRTRIAPTVSGLLHIGHARTFLAACDRAREFGGKVVLRIDDIDSQRCSRAYEDAAIEDIRSAGVHWDEGPDVGASTARTGRASGFTCTSLPWRG